MSHHLTTDRLTLRPLVAQDAERVASLIGEYEVTRWLTRVPYPYILSDAEDFIERNSNSSVTFAIVHADDLVGVIGNSDELGYWIGKPYWGRGFVTEAARAVIAEHFKSEANVLESGHLLQNAPSRAVLCKLGFVDTMMVQRPSASLGGFVDIQRMELQREVWERAQ